MRMMTGTLFSFPGDWRRRILKIVLELELVLALDCREIWLLNKRYIIWLSVSQRLRRGLYTGGSSEFEDEFEPYAGRLPLGISRPVPAQLARRFARSALLQTPP